MVKPPLSTYFGGKAGNGTYQNIINLIPRCKIFIDAMAGNGGIVCNLKLPALTVINDIDAGLISRYDVTACSTDVLCTSLHYQELIDKYDCVGSDVVFYFDPPYYLPSRKSQIEIYNYEWSYTDHLNLIHSVLSMRSKVLISHYPCDLYDLSFKSWNVHQFQSATRHGLATEKVYFNYEVPEILQDDRYRGTDFIDRQRIKRKVLRLCKKLDAMPSDDRIAIITALVKNYSSLIRQSL